MYLCKGSLIFKFLKILFTYGCAGLPCCMGFSLVSARGGLCHYRGDCHYYSPEVCLDFSLGWLLLWQSTSSGAHGPSTCSSQAPEHGISSCAARA